MGTVLRQVGEVFFDDSILAYANQFNSKCPIIIDYENKKKYEWTATTIQRICTLDSKKYLKELKDD